MTTRSQTRAHAELNLFHWYEHYFWTHYRDHYATIAKMYRMRERERTHRRVCTACENNFVFVDGGMLAHFMEEVSWACVLVLVWAWGRWDRG
jgi:restriction endonuclease Mrr